MPSGLKSLETVVVAVQNNPADDTGYGAVAYPFKIGKFEVTAAQYVEFLNAKAQADPHGLYHLHMDEKGQIGCGIQRSGTKGNYVYIVAPEYANRPVNWVSFWSACRFANWLHNGQGDGDTETGAYTLNGSTGSNEIKRNPGAKWFIPTEDEWYKAAYYDPSKPGGAGYWNYPTRSDSQPSLDFRAVNAANYYDGGYLDPNRYLTEVGAFAQARSGLGTFDQGGNVAEWTETRVAPGFRRFRGGSFGNDAGHKLGDESIPQKNSQFAGDIVGFRVAEGWPQGKNAAADFPRRPWQNPENGKPFFPMGWYEWESLVFTGDKLDRWKGQVLARSGRESLSMALSNLDQMADEGANTVVFMTKWLGGTSLRQPSTAFRENVALILAYLDHAQQCGIKVLVLIGPQAFFEAKTAEEATTMLQNTRLAVESMSKHPALLGYQIYDEPEYYRSGCKKEDLAAQQVFINALVKLQKSIREWDKNKNHPIQVVFNAVPYTGGEVANWKMFLPAVDSFQIDRYPLGSGSAYFALQERGPLAMAWSIAHGAAALNERPELYNPAPCLQGVGLSYFENGHWWRDPLYEETRYMAYSSLTAGAWGIIHWIRNPSSLSTRRNVARLHAELRQLLPAFELSYEDPPFTVAHDHEGITRDFLTDCISDISTLALEDEKNYYLIVSDNSGVFEDVSLRLKLPNLKDTKTREALVLNEDWSREIKYISATGDWVLATHKMCFGDVNIWVIPKEPK